MLRSLTLSIVATLTMIGCKGPIFPVLDKIEQVVQADLEANPPKTDAQIASDVCAAMGGTATTDAVCAGVETVIQDTVAILVDTGLLSTVGQKRALDYKASHAAAAKP